MKFQIGQRVKIISNKHDNGVGAIIGRTGQITGERFSSTVPRYDVTINRSYMNNWFVYEDDMIPYDEKLNWFYEGGEG